MPKCGPSTAKCIQTTAVEAAIAKGKVHWLYSAYMRAEVMPPVAYNEVHRRVALIARTTYGEVYRRAAIIAAEIEVHRDYSVTATVAQAEVYPGAGVRAKINNGEVHWLYSSSIHDWLTQ